MRLKLLGRGTRLVGEEHAEQMHVALGTVVRLQWTLLLLEVLLKLGKDKPNGRVERD